MTTESRRRYWPLLLAAAAAIGLYAYTTIDVESDPTKTRPKGGVAELETLAERDDTNILFIVVDTLRAERMSAYGYERVTTPFLTKLASTGIRFERNIAQSSWTKSSMASMWSSRTPLRVGVTRFNHTISDQVQMPAEILKEAGFKTIGLYRNGWVNPSFGFSQGFEKYYKPLGGYQDPQIQRMRPNAQLSGTDESVMADATEFLRIHGKTSRWFLYLHLMDVHEYTYDQESALFGNSVSDIYDNSILREDWVISTLYDYMGRQGLLEKTIVVLISDHGEAFGERGFEGHAREVFPETTETPFIVSLPFELSPGVVVKTRSSNVDVWPTLLDLIGLSSPETDLDGVSRREAILAAIEGAEAPKDEAVSIAFLDENWGTPGGERLASVSIVDGPLRYVSGSALNGRPYEVLLSSEDGSKSNQLATKPDDAERLRATAKEVLEQKSAFESKEIKLDQMQLDQLRALGYQLP
ncbi:sulfatase [Myxococcota bacterium]|nr:sulfatase [Myxococcota bacterium]